MDIVESAGRVVAGTDGSTTARHASDWAAMVASNRGLPLLLVSVVNAKSPLVLRFTSHEERLERAVAEAKELLAAEQDHIRAAHPDLQIETVVTEGSPAGILVEATRDAALVVVGSRGHSAPLAVRTFGGFSDAVATHAHGPIAIVPEDARDHDGPIVVGVDDAPEARAAIRLAFQIAEANRRKLVALHGYQIVLSRTRLYNKPVDELEAELAAEVDEIVGPIAADHPDVSWTRLIVQNHPVGALVEASRTASIVVLGSRGHGGFAGMLLGSTSREVLRHADCPVYVVRSGLEPAGR